MRIRSGFRVDTPIAAAGQSVIVVAVGTTLPHIFVLLNLSVVTATRRGTLLECAAQQEHKVGHGRRLAQR